MFHIVDDDIMLCELNAEVLKSAGFEVAYFTNPLEYLNQLLTHKLAFPTCIFTDLSMPEMNGHELIDKIQRKHPNQKIVVISGFDLNPYPNSNLICHRLIKPFHPLALLEIAQAITKCDDQGCIAAKPICKRLMGLPKEADYACPFDCEAKEQR